MYPCVNLSPDPIKLFIKYSAPNDENKKGSFFNAMLPDIAFPMKRGNPLTLVASQTLVIELEDDLITSSKWKKDVQIKNYQALISSSSNDALIQKLANDLLAIKK